MQSSLQQQQIDLAADREKGKAEMKEWYGALCKKLDHEMAQNKSEIDKKVWAEHVSARLSTPDMQTQWRAGTNQAIKEIQETHLAQAETTANLAGKINEIDEQVGRLTTAIQNFQGLGQQENETTGRLRQQKDTPH